MMYVAKKKQLVLHYITNDTQREGDNDYFPTFNYVMDVVTCAPIDTVIFFTVNVRVSMYFRMLRFGRVKEIGDAWPHWEKFLTHLSTVFPSVRDVSVVLSLTVALLCFTHVIACVLYLAGSSRFDTADCAVVDNCGWVQTQSTNASQDWTEITEPVHQYITAYYYAFAVLTTVGFGDIHAFQPHEMVINVAVMLAASYVFAVIMGNIANIITR